MFPSQQLISYVFANPDDEYRGSDLLTLNLKQYLWKSLHKHYSTVYFLSIPDDHTFRVQTFGDRDAEPYRPSLFTSFFKSQEQVFGEWLLKQLCREREKAVAIVCPLDEFCQVLSGDAWAPVLKKIANAANRTGIFVLTASPYAEDSRRYLLESPVFEYPHETAVTGNRDRSQCVYTAIRKEKPDNYRCLNAFTPERINDLLLHICAAYPERSMSAQERLIQAEDLAARLQSGLDLPGQQEVTQPTMYQTYRWLYDQLCTQTVWDSLTAPDRVCLPSGAVQGLSILRSPACYAGKCITLQLPAWTRGKLDSDKALQDIRQLLSAPTNSAENQVLVDTALEFMKQLRQLEEGDIDTCSLLLDALRFCATWVHTCEDDRNYKEVIRMLDGLKVCTANSATCFCGERDLSAREADPPTTAQELLALSFSRDKLNEKKKSLHNFVSMLKANMITLEYNGYTDSSVLLNLCLKEMQSTDMDTFVLNDSPVSSHNPYASLY